MEKDIHTLHKILEKYIRENIFSDFLLTAFSLQLKQLLVYMEEKKITIYNEKVGEQYLIYLLETRKSKNKNLPYYYTGYITRLNDMLNNRWTIKTSKTDYSIPFPSAIGAYVMNFLTKYVKERRLNLSTRNNYYRALFKFCERMEFDGIQTLSQITAENILDFVSSIQNCKDHIAIILRALLKNLYEEQIIDYRTSAILEKLKTKPHEKRLSYYSPIEIMGIEESIDRRSPMGKRDYAIILLATRLGLRTSDIRLLKFSDIDWNDNRIYLEQFKTKSMIELPLLTDVGESIIDYIQHGRPNSMSKYIFLRAHSPYEPLTSTGLYVIIQNCMRLANISLNKRHHGLHAMRHSLATNMLKNGTSLIVISDSLGHASTETTMKYLHFDTNGLLKCSLNVPVVNKNFYLQNNRDI